MRAPTQHHRRPGLAAAHGWAHPYTGLTGLAVFYNDGGNPPAPDPADPPKPGPPPTPAGGQFTQDDLDRIAAKEKAQGQRAGARQALEDFAKEHGFTNVDDAKAFITTARQAQEDALSEQEKREKAIADREAKAEQREQAAAARERAVRREQALTRLGAFDTTDDQGNTIPNLQDALAMLDRDLAATPDADEQTVADTAAKLKARRPELFGTTTPAAAPGQMPPAPGGSPAGGPPPRQQPATKPGSRGLEMARLRGHNRNAA
ncbi:hypothetical protein KVH31_34665 [Streptomyces olivaceus]|uniref:hypothetical protein n=1 Tax=Streptomyces olivaceus TaxID=47716 RepID=UPI001CCE2A58|nr:hypothetical protein [Streptomyces olivaceus]MBZ6211641.1 hypothetical protein [Streptomyces olivaceus]